MIELTPQDLKTQLKWLAQRTASTVERSRRMAPREVMALCETHLTAMVNPAEEMWRVYVKTVNALLIAMDLRAPHWGQAPLPENLPAVALHPTLGVLLVLGQNAEKQWLLEGPNGLEKVAALPTEASYASLTLEPRDESVRSAAQLFRDVMMARRHVLVYVALAAILANVLALAGSLYSMQVYDRVIPSHSVSTLVVLTMGAVIAAIFELSIKFARSLVQDRALREIDMALGHHVLEHLLSVRMDQFPASVGTLSAQVRGYETVRVFMSSAILFVVVDLPFAMVFLAIIAALAGIQIALIPVAFLLLALVMGLFYRHRIDALSKVATATSNRKLGLLVESMENAEMIKAAGAGWQILGRWNMLNREVVGNEIQIRQYTEQSSYMTAFIQQTSYVALVCAGAYVTTTGDLTMGGIIACSILSGRVLAPIGMIPNLVVQRGHGKAALESLEKVFQLQRDNHAVAVPLVPDRVSGQLSFSDVHFAYRGRPDSMVIPALHIGAGEKVGILGSVGAGKSTLLKLLAGMYVPRQGQVLLDGVDVQQISRAWLSERLGYLPQEVRLFQGTLRENLLCGIPAVPDTDVLAACQASGLMGLVSQHAEGLDLLIPEGGRALSGGQKQLIAITRLLLAKPSVWLLDEPSSAMDELSELRAMNALQRAAQGQTLVLVTHKPALVGMVDRLILLGPKGIVLDGPRDMVLQRLRQAQPVQAPAVAAMQATT